tara:strand:+ start:377 stop:871 length:495 start_codon:yes stop_codon:yes gene_type:complete
MTFIYPIERRSRATVNDLQVALKSFQTEYARWPADLERLPSEMPVRLPSGVVETLLAETGRFSSEDNPRAFRFIELPLARQGKGGVIETVDGVLDLVDRWGSRYFVVVDVDEDGKVANPEAAVSLEKRGDKDAPAVLPVSIVIFSAGPDREPETWTDNIASWRQ